MSGSLTRRQVVIGAAGVATTAACAGVGAPEGQVPRPSPHRMPLPTQRSGASLEPGTLFLPGQAQGRGLPPKAQATTPAWFRRAPAFFCPAPRTGGSVMLTFTAGGRYGLPHRLRSFTELPKLLAEARQLGTDIVYLIDWYEGAQGQDADEAVWNKGDYVPRQDLGGADALREGIAAIQAKGGRVLSYLELFTVAKVSTIGKKRGADWALVTREHREDGLYPDAHKLCPTAPGLDEYMVSTARRIVGELGFDGLHLDSYGYQRGWKCVADHGHPKGEGSVFDQGAVELARRVGEAIRAEKSDAVLMCEGPMIPNLYRHVSASQDWSVGELLTRWVWDQAGFTQVFTAHWSLDDIHQILALGHKLSLGGGFWHEEPPSAAPSAWLAKQLPDPVPQKPDRRFRRFYLEPFMRTLHAWRNAAILAGAPVPSIERATPRRWERDDSFDSHQGYAEVAADLRAAAALLDPIVSGRQLSAPTAHIKQLCTARAAMQPFLEGSTPRVADRGDDWLVWRFEGGARGTVLTMVNVGNEARSATVDGSGAFDELLTSSRVEARGGHVELQVPPHAVRLFCPA
ncbi:MAG: hypothetical protein H6738_10465 [Alphaproteobacteria bacterium]|nr:hypothetical protein [Alphaproteobacteria bacterium]MCB9697192.1 hypothetical protein [Alphaproteobacteria bacterium]